MSNCSCKQRVLSGHLDKCPEKPQRPAEIDFQQVPLRRPLARATFSIFVFRGSEHERVIFAASPRERDEVTRALRYRGALPVGSGLLNTEQSFSRRLTFDVREGRRR